MHIVIGTTHSPPHSLSTLRNATRLRVQIDGGTYKCFIPLKIPQMIKNEVQVYRSYKCVWGNRNTPFFIKRTLPLYGTEEK